MSIRPSFFQLTHPLNFDLEKSRCLSKYYSSKNITSRTKKNEKKKKKTLKRFDPSTKSSNHFFFLHLEDPGSMLKYWLLPNPRHPFDSGLNFRDGLMPLGRQRKNWGLKISVGPLASLVFCVFGIEKTKGLLVFVDVMRLLHCLFHCCLFHSVEPKNKVQKKCTAWANNMLAWKTFHQVVIYTNWKMTSSLSKQHNQGQEQHHLSLILIIAKIHWGVSLSSNVSLLLPIVFVVDLSLPASRDSSN